MLARLLERGKTSGREDDNAEVIKKRFSKPLATSSLSLSNDSQRRHLHHYLHARH